MFVGSPGHSTRPLQRAGPRRGIADHCRVIIGEPLRPDRRGATDKNTYGTSCPFLGSKASSLLGDRSSRLPGWSTTEGPPIRVPTSCCSSRARCTRRRATLCGERIKGKSSWNLIQEYKHLGKLCWGRHLWARGFFVASSGNVTDEIIMEDIQTQARARSDDDFRVEESRLPRSRAFSRLPNPPASRCWLFCSR